MVNHLPPVGVSAVIGEGSFHLRRQLDEWLRPQKTRRCFLRELDELLCFHLPQVSINKEKILEQASLIVEVLSLTHDGWDHAIHEIVREVNGIGVELLGKY